MRLAKILALLLPIALSAEEKPAPAKAVFIISGLECGSCVYMVQTQLAGTDGVKEVEVLQGLEGFARVNYDPKLISEHQIAQAVREAPGLHGMPYIATMKLRVPGFSQHVAQVKALFEKWKPMVELEVWDERQGDLIVFFAELTKDAKGAVPKGWSLAQLSDGLRALGLKHEILSPDVL
ncbi:MAG: heavy-metal-associated domain-containing protein [Prosthecobacter sp.]